jgi:hypothetical protein
MSQYRSALVAVLGAILMALYSALNGDNHVAPDEAIQIGIAAVTAFIVWNSANTTAWQYAKPIAAAILAVLNGLAANWTGGISSAEWVNLIIAAATAAGILVFPNRPSVTASQRRAAA